MAIIMINGQLLYDYQQQSDNSSDYSFQYVDSLLKHCYCQLVQGKDYELEAGASAINGLINEHETADVYLYAAIEREDWLEVSRLYKTVFRPYLQETATLFVNKALLRQPAA